MRERELEDDRHHEREAHRPSRLPLCDALPRGQHVALAGEQQNDHKLLVQAEDNFRNAKKVQGFAPPEKFVSPKIVKKFQETS